VPNPLERINLRRSPVIPSTGRVTRKPCRPVGPGPSSRAPRAPAGPGGTGRDRPGPGEVTIDHHQDQTPAPITATGHPAPTAHPDPITTQPADHHPARRSPPVGADGSEPYRDLPPPGCRSRRTDTSFINEPVGGVANPLEGIDERLVWADTLSRGSPGGRRARRGWCRARSGGSPPSWPRTRDGALLPIGAREPTTRTARRATVTPRSPARLHHMIGARRGGRWVSQGATGPVPGSPDRPGLTA
jgi:hypothetical protein